jgi:glycosyltransferase involved in cell wall biosynthesis
MVSVIVPAYNYGRFIGSTLESVEAQTLHQWECIVVDDGSADDTSRVVEHFCQKDSRFNYIYQNNSGPSAARNTGIRSSAGKYLQFLDADDLIEPRKLECQVNYLERHPEVDIVYDHTWYFDSTDPQKRRLSRSGSNERYPPEIRGSGSEALKSLVKINHMTPVAPLVRRSVIESVGDFDESFDRVEDWDYWLRCAAKGMRFQRCEFTNARGCYRVHDGSLSTDDLRMCRAAVEIRKGVATLTDDRAILNLNRRCWSEDMGRYGVELISSGDVPLGVLYLMRAAFTSFEAKLSLRLLACALLTPFVSAFVKGERFRVFAYSSWRRAILALLGR